MRDQVSAEATLPEDGAAGVLAGRVWRPDAGGPSIVSIREDGVYDLSRYDLERNRRSAPCHRARIDGRSWIWAANV